MDRVGKILVKERENIGQSGGIVDREGNIGHRGTVLDREEK